MLAEAPDMVLVAEAADAGELLLRGGASAWDVGLLNDSPRDHSGHNTLRALRQKCPTTGLVALTFALDDAFLDGCLSAGATALVATEDLDVALLPAIRAAAAGQRYLSAAVSGALMAGPPT